MPLSALLVSSLKTTKAMMCRMALSDWDNLPTLETFWQPFSRRSSCVSVYPV